MLRNKKGNKDLKKHYPLLVQSGLILALLLLIVGFSYNMGVDSKNDDEDQQQEEKQEAIETEEVVRTKQVDKPPQPPSPQPPKEVPNDEIIEGKTQDKLDQIDQEMSSGGDKMSMPPPPEEEEEEEQIHETVEQQPKLRGSMDSLRSQIEYPAMAREAQIEGRVYVEFVVTKKGNVKDAEIVRGLGGGLDKEALRVIKDAKFQPGIQQGHPVNVKMTMPIIFQLDSEVDS